MLSLRVFWLKTKIYWKKKYSETWCKVKKLWKKFNSSPPQSFKMLRITVISHVKKDLIVYVGH